MVILGVDPGFSVTGFGIMKKEGGKTLILEYGSLQLSAKDSLSQRIGTFHAFFTTKLATWPIQALALETPFLGKNAQNFLKLGYLRGILYLLADQHKLELYEFTPREVKKALTGYGAAEKEQVARVLTRMFLGLELPTKLDITDALAVTLCGLWKSSQPVLPIRTTLSRPLLD